MSSVSNNFRLELCHIIIYLSYIYFFTDKLTLFVYLSSKLLLFPRFLKKCEGDIVIASVRPSFRLFIMLSPPKPLDKIQPNLVCELLTWMGRAT